MYKLELREENSRWRWAGMHLISGYAEYKHYEDLTRRYSHAIVSAPAWLPPGVHHLQATGTVGGLRPPGGQVAQGHYNFYLGDNSGYDVDYAPASYALGTYPMVYGNPSTGFARESLEIGLATNANAGTFTVLKSRGAVLQSNFLKNRVITTFGWRHDERFSKSRAPMLLLNDGFTLDPASDRWADGDWGEGKGMTKTAGVVVKPLGWLRLYSNTSDSFRPANPAQDVYRNMVTNPSGEGRDYGIMLNLFSGKLFFRLNDYRMEQNNDRNGTIVTILARALGIDFAWRGGAVSPAYRLQDRAAEWALDEASRRGQALTAAHLDQRVSQIMQVPVEYLTEPATGPRCRPPSIRGSPKAWKRNCITTRLHSGR